MGRLSSSRQDVCRPCLTLEKRKRQNYLYYPVKPLKSTFTWREIVLLQRVTSSPLSFLQLLVTLLSYLHIPERCIGVSCRVWVNLYFGYRRTGLSPWRHLTTSRSSLEVIITLVIGTDLCSTVKTERRFPWRLIGGHLSRDGCEENYREEGTFLRWDLRERKNMFKKVSRKLSR